MTKDLLKSKQILQQNRYKIFNMKIYLLDINNDMCNAWKEYFEGLYNIEVVNDNFKHFMDEHLEIDCVVSPANSFGLMDGGYDKAIIDYFGTGLMNDVKKAIIYNWHGEQPVGTSLSVPIYNRVINTIYGSKICTLIHTPTMRTPEKISDSRIIYQCMRTTLIEAKRKQVKHIVIPAFGGATGGISYNEIARLMFLAYEQIVNSPIRPQEINWKYAMSTASKVKYGE